MSVAAFSDGAEGGETGLILNRGLCPSSTGVPLRLPVGLAGSEIQFRLIFFRAFDDRITTYAWCPSRTCSRTSFHTSSAISSETWRVNGGAAGRQFIHTLRSRSP